MKATCTDVYLVIVASQMLNDVVIFVNVANGAAPGNRLTDHWPITGYQNRLSGNRSGWLMPTFRMQYNYIIILYHMNSTSVRQLAIQRTTTENTLNDNRS